MRRIGFRTAIDFGHPPAEQLMAPAKLAEQFVQLFDNEDNEEEEWFKRAIGLDS